MLNRILAALALLCACLPALGADFCAVRVTLSDQNGAAAALVELRDSKGAVVQRSDAPKGVAEFCDFDFGLYSIDVGGTTCGAVVIPNIRLRYGVEQNYRVYLNGCFGWGSVPVGACFLYFRISGEAGRPVASASVASTAIGGVRAMADSYGRAGVWVTPGTSETFEFTKSGYRPARDEYTCLSPVYTERAITMLLPAK